MSSSNRKKPPLVAERRRAPAKPARSGRARKTRRSAPKRPRGPLGMLRAALLWVLRIVWRLTWRLTAVVVLIVGLGVAYFATQLPPIEELIDGRARGSVTLLDRNGEVFAWRGEQFGGMITADTVSPYLRDAIIATEDKRFRWHFGVDPYGTAAAMARNMREGRGPFDGAGGSSITQQTAKLLCIGVAYDPAQWESEAAYEADCRRTTLWRKVKEAVYAMAMEARYSKDEILTIYLNRAYLGAGSRGFEAASQRYFGISAAEVSPAQAAMLAGLLKAPSAFAPTNNLARAQDRAATVIRLMQEQGYLTAAEAQEAIENPAVLSSAARRRAGGYFADWVMEQGPSFFTESTTEDVIIRTTLDPRIQEAAETALLRVFETQVSPDSVAQAAIVVMSADGAVRAMVGGRDVTASGTFNRATQALRQTGSSFKPFVYATALDLGWSPLDTVEDSPLTIDVPGSGPWTPKNYTDEYVGTVTLVDALVASLNIPAVRVSEAVGRENVRKVAEGFGIRSDLADGPALALGASEATLIEMVGAYAGILNGGSAVKPYGLLELRLQGDTEPLMGTSGGIRERVISEPAAQQLVWMMMQVVERGTGRRAKIEGHELAGKTGTTNAARDAWFIGFSADYVVGVWMGNDDNTPLRNVTGSGLPAEIWRQTMEGVLEGQPPRPLPALPPRAPRPTDVRPGEVTEELADDILEQVILDILQQQN